MPRKRLESKEIKVSKKSSTKKKTSKSKTLRSKSSRRSSPGFFQWLDTVSPVSILIIGICVVTVSVISSLFVDMYQWAGMIPASMMNISSWVFEYILTVIFALVTAAIVILWNIRTAGRAFLIWLIVLLGILHVMWNMLFFGLHVLNASFFIALALWILLWIVIILAWRRSRTAALLFLPYLMWLSFITAFCGWSLLYL